MIFWNRYERVLVGLVQQSLIVSFKSDKGGRIPTLVGIDIETIFVTDYWRQVEKY